MSTGAPPHGLRTQPQGNRAPSRSEDRINGGTPTSSTPSRAELFDDEKERIKKSCFWKKDDDGNLLESYITHIRIIEDAMYPTSPPPPDSGPQNKKPRLIIVSVRKSGRVRMHKARENANGTFSIGKTWPLDELTAIQSYGGPPAANPKEEQQRQWANDLGFTVTILKQYYWHAATTREKDFFVGSLVKIYKMYTGGKLPQLIGFGQQELARLHTQLAPSPRPSPAPSDGGSPTMSPVATGPPPSSIMSRPPPLKRPPQESSQQRPPSRDKSQPVPPMPRQYAAQGTSSHQRPPSRDQKQPVQLPYPTPETTMISPPSPKRDRASSPARPHPAPPPLSSQRPSSRDSKQAPRKPSQESIPYRPGSRNQARPAPLQISSQDVNAPRPRSGGQDRAFPQMHPPAGVPSALSVQKQPARPHTPDSESHKLSNAPSDISPPVPPQSPNRQRVNAAKQNFDAVQTKPAYKPGTTGLGTADLPRNDTAGSKYNNGVKSPVPSESIAPPPPNMPPFPAYKEEQPPERKRPSLHGPSHSAGRKSLGGESTDIFLTPNASPGEEDKVKASAPVLERPSQAAPAPVELAAEPDAPRAAVQKEPEQAVAHRAPSAPSIGDDLPSAKESQVSPEPMPTSPPVPAVPAVPAEPTDEEVHRPGLGPMIKKKSNKDVASAFRRAATAYNAFKPRVGGAGQRLREQNEKKSNEPDGITGVVPAPSLARVAQQNISTPSISEQPPAEERKSQIQVTDVVPEVKVSDATTEQNDRLPTPKVEKSRTPSPDKAAAKSKAAEARRQKRRSGISKYLAALDIDPSLLEGRTVDIDAVFNDHGWVGDNHLKTVDSLAADIRRDIARVEAGSYLNHFDQKDERVEAVEKLLDKAIAECDELDGLLTLYGAELSTLNDDIAYIEAQSQGLQVQTANQKLLQTELQQLLKTVSISTTELQTLRQAQFGSPGGLEMIESTLSLLYKAMITIDPTLKASGSTAAGTGVVGYSAEVGNMRALQERRDGYRNESTKFLARLKRHMDSMFKFAIDEVARSQQNGFNPSGAPKLDLRAYEQIRSILWVYSPLILFSRDIEPAEWQDITRLYIIQIKPTYQEKFRENLNTWRNSARKPTGEELEILFTTQEKEAEGLATTARKLTVKRSQTLARTLRSSTGDGVGGRSAHDKLQAGKVHAYEAFTAALDEMIPIIFQEQNFIVDFFHMSSLEATEFPDAVAAVPPNLRTGTDLSTKKPFDPDRGMAKRVSQVMQEMFSFWQGDVQGLVDWALQMDALQGIGLLYALERKLLELEESNQEFIVHTLQKVHDHLVSLFTRFVDEQIRAIEETKVKIKKRKGVIAFMRVFPNFSAAIENMVPTIDDKDDYEVTEMINNAYQRISRAMFESLRIIAKEGPTAMAGHGVQGQGAGDPEDKEALNYHILLIENMNHYLNEVEAHGSAILENWRDQAAKEMFEHMELYIDAIIRRPLGKLLDFVESTEAVLATTPDPTSIASRASHSRQTFKKIISSYDTREVRRGIEALRKRVEKHFGEADEPTLSAALVQKVLGHCESRYLDVADRTRRIAETVYDGGASEIEWRRDDIVNAFKR